METLKFLMITTHFPPFHLGGDAVFVEYLSKELAGRGHEVHVMHNPTVYEVFRSQKTKSFEGAIDDGIQRHGYRQVGGAIGPLAALTIGACSRQKKMASNLVESIKPDVVHWHNTRAFLKQPVVFGNEIALYTSHDYGTICPRSNLLRPDLSICKQASMCAVCSMRWGKPPQLWRLNGWRVLKYPENLRVIAPSQSMADTLNEDGVKVNRVMRNFVPDPGVPDLRTCGPRRSLVYLGMLEMHKGLRTLVKAFGKSSDDHEFQLDIIGEGTLRRELEETVRGLGLETRVRIHGFLPREEAESIRMRAAAQIVPSEWLENCPLTILEAFAHGVPVIGSNMGGIPELVGPDSGSRVFPGGDSKGLADAMVDLWNQREDLNTLCEQARKAYDGHYRPESHLKEYFKLIADSL